MNQPEKRRPSRKPHHLGWKISLRWKIASTFAAVIIFLGLLVTTIVFTQAGNALRSQFERRAFTIATNLSDVAAGFVVGKNVLELDALVTKYARLEGVAYVFIEDGNGNILTHSSETFASEPKAPFSSKDHRKSARKELTVQGRAVYETRVPILEGQVGAAHVGFWADSVESEIQGTLLPMMGWIVVLFFIGILLSICLSHLMVRPILRLAETADKISRGNLEIPVHINWHGEVGSLARSLERLRASLKTAMSRLTPV